MARGWIASFDGLECRTRLLVNSFKQILEIYILFEINKRPY